MIFAGADRDALRQVFVEAWHKRRAGAPMEPLEHAVADVVGEHPDYHALLDDLETVERDFGVEAGETNPFLHLSMHLAIREQLGTDRPVGIRSVHRRLASRDDAHGAEHRMMEYMAQALWEAQRAASPPDEQRYLACLECLLGSR
jgi:hypothetical protein